MNKSNRSEKSILKSSLGNLKNFQKIKNNSNLNSKAKSKAIGQQLFSSFLYKDQVTRYRYELSKLKSSKRISTCPNQNAIEQKNEITLFDQEFKVLRTINQNRRKDLIDGYKQKSIQKNIRKMTQIPPQNYQQLNKLKRKIRKQVFDLNQQFLRQYLYNQQPFSKMLVQINKYTNTGIIDQARINYLQQNIAKCISDRKENRRFFSKQKIDDKIDDNFFQRKFRRQANQRKIQKGFQEIWQEFRKQIGLKIKMEGQYNLYSDQLKNNLR